MIFVSLWNSKERHALCHVFFRCWNAAGVSRAQSWCQHATEGPGWLGNAAVMLFWSCYVFFLCFFVFFVMCFGSYSHWIPLWFFWSFPCHMLPPRCTRLLWQSNAPYGSSKVATGHFLLALNSRFWCFLWVSIDMFAYVCQFAFLACSVLALCRAQKSSKLSSSSVLMWMPGPIMEWTVRPLAIECGEFGVAIWQMSKVRLYDFYRFLEAEQFEQKCKHKHLLAFLRFLARNPEQVRVLIDAKADLHSHCEPLGADLGVKLHVWQSETTILKASMQTFPGFLRFINSFWVFDVFSCAFTMFSVDLRSHRSQD